MLLPWPSAPHILAASDLALAVTIDTPALAHITPPERTAILDALAICSVAAHARSHTVGAHTRTHAPAGSRIASTQAHSRSGSPNR